MPQPLEFWFEFASTYSYVAAMRIEEECKSGGVPLIWKPFLLGPIFHAQLGIQDSPFNLRPARGKYMWRDLERLCAKHRLDWKRPGAFPRNSTLAARVACIGVDQDWMGGFVRAIYRANFAEDLDIADREVIAGVLRSLGLDANELLAEASSPERKSLLRTNTDAAMARGIFGAPTYFIGDELFFGQDRSADAVAWAKET